MIAAPLLQFTVGDLNIWPATVADKSSTTQQRSLA